MNEIELLIPGEFRLHLRLPFNMMELLENLEHNNPVLINAFDDQDRNLVIECIRVEDLITMRVVNDNREYISDTESNGWTCSVSDILAQLNPMSSSVTDTMARPGDDFMTSVMIKEERNHEESETAFILSMVNEYMEPDESCTLVQLSEEQPAEEVIFGNDCKVLAYSTNEPLVAVEDDSGNSENYYIQIHPVDFENLADGSSIIISHVEPYSREPVDKRKVEAVVGSVEEIYRPKIVSDLLVFRCGLCSCQFLKEETSKTHLRRFHRHSDATLLAEVAGTTYVCTVCSQPFWDVCRWRLHMKHVHGIVSDHQQKPHSKVNARHQKRMTSWDNRKFAQIECLICKRKMAQFESYYLHIHKEHRSHSLYKAAVKHMIQVRETRLRRKCRTSMQCFKCQEMLTEYSLVSHLRVLHADDPCINEMIARTKLSIKKIMKSHGVKVNVRCQFCEKEMTNSTLRSHLEFHCPALNAVVPDGEIKQEVLGNAAKNEVETVLVRMPRTTVCEQCNKVMTLRSFYHHQRRVHGIGINNAKIYSCSYCKKPFWDQYHLQNHLLTHTRDRAFVCLVCRRSFINLVSYTEHHRKVHERQFLHACSTCGRGFWKRVDKLRHNCKPQNLCLNQLRNAHLTAKAKATMEKWVGPFYLEMDRREADKITTNKNRGGADDKRKQISAQGEKKLVCIVCKKSFQSIRYFQSHFRYSHLQDYDLICECCGLGFWNITQMTAHKCDPSRRAFNEKKRHLLATRAKEMLRNVPKPYYYILGVPEHSLDYPELIKIDTERKVPYEEKGNGDSIAVTVEHDSEVWEKVRFANKDQQSVASDSLIQQSNKTGTQESKKLAEESVDGLQLTAVQPGYCLCSICGKEIKVKNYYPHMRRVHCDDSHKPIVWKVCDQCGYRCQDNYKFRRHCMTHNKGKGIPCELCNRLSYEVVDYNQHFKRRHLGQFNIRCNDCGKGFWKMNAMQAHTCYPELKEENLRMQKLKEETAIKKRNVVRKTTGINSSIDEESAKQHNNHRKTGAKKNSVIEELSAQIVRTAEHDEENVFNGSEKITMQSPKQRSPGRPRKLRKSVTSMEPKFCLEGKNIKQCTERSKLEVDSQLQNGTEPVTAGKMIEQQRSAGLTMTDGRNEIKTNIEKLSLENIVQKRRVTSLLDRVSSNGEETVKKKRKLENTADKMQYSCSVGGLNESSHKYGTRKKQVSFRALLGKK